MNFFFFISQSWTCLAGCILIIGPILYLVHAYSPRNTQEPDSSSSIGLGSTARCLWYIYGALLQQGLYIITNSRNELLSIGFDTWIPECVKISANTLTKDPDIRIIRISEPEASDPYYPDIRIIRVSVLFGYPNYPDILIIRVSGSGYLFITKLRIVYRPV